MIDITEIKIAYKKLKSYIYHENFSLNLRIQLAKFEDGQLNDRLEEFRQEINQYISNPKSKRLQKYIDNIGYSLMPKKIKNEADNFDANDGYLYTNTNRQKQYDIEKSIAFIECPIELHLITIIWIMKIGHYLDAEIGSHCYGNRLVRNHDDNYEEHSLKLFKRYYINYNNWRDEAIKKAQEIHEINLDVAILNLDLKDYYHSVDFDIKKIKKSNHHKLWENNEWLNNIINSIHNKYKKVLKDDNIVSGNKNILPIGLISSNILANYYLKNLDDTIVTNIKPAFYGRYVDDILIVYANPSMNISELSLDEFIAQNLANVEFWNNEISINEDASTHGEYNVKIEKNEILFQLEKVKLYYFNHLESINLLEEFEKEIRKNSSEFKFQPESNEIFESFEDASYKITYGDTVNKLRSINGFSIDKLGASKHLTKLINSTRNAEKLSTDKFEKLNDRVTSFFSGRRSLELNALWEKVFTFYLVNGAKNQLINFAKEQIKAIGKLKLDNASKDNNVIEMKIQESLFNHLGNCFSMAAALNLNFFSEWVGDEISDERYNYNSIETQLFDYLSEEAVNKTARKIINANLLRHNYVFHPLINYCVQSEGTNYLSKTLHKETNFEIDPLKIEYSPRFIHYHEICFFYQIKNWFSAEDIPQKFNTNYAEFIYQKYTAFNKIKTIFNKRKSYPICRSINKEHSEITTQETVIISNQKKEKLHIGLVNTIVNSKNSFESLAGFPNLSFKRLDELNQILNQAIVLNKCDLIVFPEISIPYQWLPILSSFAKRNQVAIVCGIEHFQDKKKNALNFVATILPFQDGQYNNALIDFRLKKDYSPEETEQIIGNKYKIPYKACRDEKLKFFQWENFHFNVLNCYELADIHKRALFRGNVDFLVTVEHNQDVNYFSNITESVARDIHSYIIQVNTANFGDSRITQPSETFRKDILKVKGGKNIFLAIDEIDILAIRTFQKQAYLLQRQNKTFKPTPPNYQFNTKRK